MWGGDRLDLDAYLARIGLTGSMGDGGGTEEAAPLAPGFGGRRESVAAGAKLTADVSTLRALQRAHVAAIPFENLEIMLGRPILLDIEALQAKLVRQRRGFYCYEQNLLFAAALERLGFSVTGLGARVRMGSDKLTAETHMLLLVSIDGEGWIADVGFGGEGLLEPLPWVAGCQHRQGDWTFGLASEADGVCSLRSLHSDGWFDLYAFTSEQRYLIDYEVRNYYVSTHERSPYRLPAGGPADRPRRAASFGRRATFPRTP